MSYPNTNYPTNLDTPTNPSASSDTSTFDHAGLHAFENNAIVALETKVGKNGSVDTNSHEYKIAQLQTATTTNASDTVKGITKLSVAPVSGTNPIAVGDNDPRILTTQQSGAVAGSSGVPSATNPFVTLDNVYTADTDQTQTTQNNYVETGMADTTGYKHLIAQSFIPVKTKIRGVKLYKSADTGTFTGTITIALQGDSAGSPDGISHATQTISNATWLTYSVGEFEVDWTEYSMIAGNTYWMVISTSTSDNSNHPNLGINSAGGYANGSTKYKNTTDGWVGISTIDLYFKTLQGIDTQVVQTDSSGSIPVDFFDVAKMPVNMFEQKIGLDSGTSASGNYASALTSETDGSVIYMIITVTGGTSILVRYQRDTNTGKYFFTHKTSTNVSSGGNTIVALGNYIYHFKDIGTNTATYRYDKADLTNSTLLTMPTIPQSGFYVSSFTDGKYLYISTNDSSTFYQLSVSGTTLSTVTSYTINGSYNNNNQFAFDGKNTYSILEDLNTSGSGASSINEGGHIYKFSDTNGVNAPTSTTIYMIGTDGFETNSVTVGFIPIDSKRAYIVRSSMLLGRTTPTFYSYLTLIPISKP